jgi:hypothetical protein
MLGLICGVDMSQYLKNKSVVLQAILALDGSDQISIQLSVSHSGSFRVSDDSTYTQNLGVANLGSTTKVIETIVFLI